MEDSQGLAIRAGAPGRASVPAPEGGPPAPGRASVPPPPPGAPPRAEQTGPRARFATGEFNRASLTGAAEAGRAVVPGQVSPGARPVSPADDAAGRPGMRRGGRHSGEFTQVEPGESTGGRHSGGEPAGRASVPPPGEPGTHGRHSGEFTQVQPRAAGGSGRAGVAVPGDVSQAVPRHGAPEPSGRASVAVPGDVSQALPGRATVTPPSQARAAVAPPGDASQALPGRASVAVPGDVSQAIPGRAAVPGDVSQALPGRATVTPPSQARAAVAPPGDVSQALPGRASVALPSDVGQAVPGGVSQAPPGRAVVAAAAVAAPPQDAPAWDPESGAAGVPQEEPDQADGAANALRAKLRSQRRLRLASLIAASVVALILLPAIAAFRSMSSDPVFASLDSLDLPSWAATQVDDRSSGSRWCYLECQFRERTVQSGQSSDETTKVYAEALTEAGWQPWKVANCPDQPITDGKYSCWRRDEFTLDLWVRQPECAVDAVAAQDPEALPSLGPDGGVVPTGPPKDCKGATVSIKVQAAIADTRGKPQPAVDPSLVGETPDPQVPSDPVLEPTPSPS